MLVTWNRITIVIATQALFGKCHGRAFCSLWVMRFWAGLNLKDVRIYQKAPPLLYKGERVMRGNETYRSIAAE
jgi:hypothetical protein